MQTRKTSKSESKVSSDACSLSDMSTHAGDQIQAPSSPRPSTHSSDTGRAVVPTMQEQTLLASPSPKRESWCDVLDDSDGNDTDEEFKRAQGAISPPMSPNSRAQRRSERRRRRREAHRAAREEKLATEGATAGGKKLQSKLAQVEQSPLVRGGPVQGGVVTLADIGFLCGSGQTASSPTSEQAKKSHGFMNRTPEKAGNNPTWPGIMSTAPERPRPMPVMLPQAAVSYMSPCVSPTGDSSMTTVLPFQSPTASGDASTRTVMMGSSSPMTSPMVGATGALYSVPAPNDSWYGTDASARTSDQCYYNTCWSMEASCSSPVQMVHHSFVGTSPQLSPSSPSQWSQAEALRAIMGPTELAPGMDLAAALQAAAPETYDD